MKNNKNNNNFNNNNFNITIPIATYITAVPRVHM